MERSKTAQIYREGVIITDFREGNFRISEIYFSNKIYKLTLEKGELVNWIILNECCVKLSEIKDFDDKLKALKKFENNLKIDNCKKYISDNKNNPFANKMQFVKKELASLKKQH